ncbi:MAG: site-specific integrase, partial [Pseudomonadota bacterium]
MDWNSTIKGFAAYMKLERSLSENSIQAYIHDIRMLQNYFEINKKTISPNIVSLNDLQSFVMYIHQLGMADYSQSRIISGLRAFYKYLLMEELTDKNPAELLEAPRLKRKLPEVLSIEEINLMLTLIDHSKPEGLRSRAMVETLYG